RGTIGHFSDRAVARRVRSADPRLPAERRHRARTAARGARAWLPSAAQADSPDEVASHGQSVIAGTRGGRRRRIGSTRVNRTSATGGGPAPQCRAAFDLSLLPISI